MFCCNAVRATNRLTRPLSLSSPARLKDKEKPPPKAEEVDHSWIYEPLGFEIEEPEYLRNIEPIDVSKFHREKRTYTCKVRFFAAKHLIYASVCNAS